VTSLDEHQALIENRTFDEIEIGETASLTRTLSRDDIELFAVMSGDVNPAHVDEEYARDSRFHKIIAHGMWGASLISTLLGTKLPGPGAIYLGQTLRFRRPVAVGDTVTVSVKVTAKDPERQRVTFDCECVKQDGDVAISGTAEVIAPTEKISRARRELPEVHLHEHGILFRSLLARTRGLDPIRVAVVHPVDRNALLGAVQAARAGLVVPVLIGPEERIRVAAAAEAVDISEYALVPAEHSHRAAAVAVAMARDGEVDAVMKGSLANQELLQAIVAPDTGLRAGRRMSHVFVIDVPTYPRPLFISDAALNVEPRLEAKLDIVQNAIDLALALGVETPKVAILAAVETVNPRIRSTLEAAALTKMADRGQIVGGIVDGPLAFDNAISPGAAEVKGLVSPIAGAADVLIVPDLESGTMLVKQLQHFADSQSAGVVLGGRVPVVFTNRADSPLEHMVSCALALVIARRAPRARHS
jgi:phosphotransacetylase/acyl dehydratase